MFDKFCELGYRAILGASFLTMIYFFGGSWGLFIASFIKACLGEIPWF